MNLFSYFDIFIGTPIAKMVAGRCAVPALASRERVSICACGAERFGGGVHMLIFS
jgi:hypothetical protein